MRFIERPPEIKAISSKCGRGQPAITGQQQFIDPPRRSLPPSNPNQSADKIAYHVMQKGACLKVENNQRALLSHFSTRQDLDRCLGLTFGGAKRREIVLTAQSASGILHESQIKRPMIPADPPLPEPRSLGTIEQQIAIAPTARAEARMKFFANRLRPAHGDADGAGGPSPVKPGALSGLSTFVSKWTT